VQLLACVAAGRVFLGLHVPQALPTLYLIAEGARSVFLERVNVAVRHLGLDPDILPLWVTPRTFRPSIGPELERQIEATGARLVVLDTVGLFHDGDENSASDFRNKVVKPLRDIMTRRDVSFVLVAHQVKPNQERKGRHTIRGTSALVDEVDIAFRLEAPDGERSPHRLLVFDKVRTAAHPEPIPLSFDFSFATFSFDGTAGPARGEALSARAKAREAASAESERKREEGLALWLRRHPEGDTVLGIATATGRRRNWVADQIDKLYAAGAVASEEIQRTDGRGRKINVRVWRWITGPVAVPCGDGDACSPVLTETTFPDGAV
jgi:hypothetical protein